MDTATFHGLLLSLFDQNASEEITEASSMSSPKRKAADLSPKSKKMSTSQKGDDVKSDLSFFGIKPGKSPEGQGYMDHHRKDSILKAVILKDLDNTGTLLFFCLPRDPEVSSWSEKTFFDCLRKGAAWVRQLNFASKCLFLFKDNEPVVNAKGHTLRMFQIKVSEVPPEESVIKLGRFIAKNIDEEPGNKTKLGVEPDNFFWLKDAVWSDVIGIEASMDMIIEQAGPTCDGYYEKNKDLIHTHFSKHTLGMNLARALHAPMDQVHPDLREDKKPKADCKDGEVLEFDVPLSEDDDNDEDDNSEAS